MIVRSPFKTQWFSDFVVLWISTNSFPVIFSLDQMGYLWGCHESVSRIPLDLRYMTSTIYSTQYTLSTRFVALSKKEIKLAWHVLLTNSFWPLLISLFISRDSQTVFWSFIVLKIDWPIISSFPLFKKEKKISKIAYKASDHSQAFSYISYV